MEQGKVIIAKVRDNGLQKRLTIPKEVETEDWKDGDLIKLVRVDL